MSKRLRARIEGATGRMLMQLPRALLARAVKREEYRGVALDPPMALFLRLIELSKKPPLETLEPVTARRKFSEWMSPFNVERIEVAGVEDRTIADVPVRVYESGRAGPTTIFYHGGGYVIGTLDGYDPICRHLVQGTGGSVVSVDYRLAPEHPFPSASEDAFKVLEAVAASDVSNRRLVVAGDSAGGSLAAVAALHARDQKIPLALQYLIYPATDLGHEYPSYAELVDRDILLTRPLIEWFETHTKLQGETRKHWRVSPILASSFTGVCPARVITAGFDPLRDEGEAYARKLEQAGIACTHVCYPHMPHGFLAFGGAIDSARELLDDWIKATRACL